MHKDAPQLSIRLEPQPQEAPATSGDSDTNQRRHQQAALASVRSLQEGNDIYLTCQLDANPRPAKPILWRFNGRPLQQQQATLPAAQIVVNNQSLVLRKVSRQQSGAYTCEATNQHGTNTSKPLDLVIRHAPVCLTDDM